MENNFLFLLDEKEKLILFFDLNTLSKLHLFFFPQQKVNLAVSISRISADDIFLFICFLHTIFSRKFIIIFFSFSTFFICQLYFFRKRTLRVFFFLKQKQVYFIEPLLQLFLYCVFIFLIYDFSGKKIFPIQLIIKLIVRNIKTNYWFYRSVVF